VRARGGPRGPYAKTAARRQQILRTALEVFAEQGYRGSSLREIADRVGISQAGVLHHFGSKEVLLAAVLEERDAVDKQLVRHAKGIALLDALRDLVAHNTQVPGLIRLYVTLSAEATDPEHPAHDFFVGRYARVRAEFARELAAARDTGDIGPETDVDRATQLLVAVMDGLQIQWLLDERMDMVAAFDRFLTTFRAAVGAAPRG